MRQRPSRSVLASATGYLGKTAARSASSGCLRARYLGLVWVFNIKRRVNYDGLREVNLFKPFQVWIGIEFLLGSVLDVIELINVREALRKLVIGQLLGKLIRCDVFCYVFLLEGVILRSCQFNLKVLVIEINNRRRTVGMVNDAIEITERIGANIVGA